MPILAALTQFYQMKLAIPPIKNRPAKTAQRQSGQKYECPNEVCNAIFHIFYRPEAFFRIALYWTTMNIFAIVHETIVRRKAEKIYGEPNKNNISSSGGTA